MRNVGEMLKNERDSMLAQELCTQSRYMDAGYLVIALMPRVSPLRRKLLREMYQTRMGATVPLRAFGRGEEREEGSQETALIRFL